MNGIKVKMLKSWLLLLVFISFNAEATHSNQEIVLLRDLALNSHFFGASLVDEETEMYNLYRSIKPSRASVWNPPETLSDPSISVKSYDVKIDSDNNFFVAWIGKNTVLEIYSLYVRQYSAIKGTWSDISMVSGVTENLTGDYSISIINRETEIIWTSFDERFNIESHSATFQIG